MSTYDRILNIREQIRSREFIELGRLSCTDFTRKRKMTFEDYCLFILNRKGITLKMEIDNFNEQKNIGRITESAICQQRQKLNPMVFKKLNENYVDNIYESGEYETVKGYIILAGDGSDIEIPNVLELKKEYGEAKNRKEYRSTAKATVSWIYDVVNNVIIDSRIDRYKTCERELVKQGIEEVLKILKDKKIIMIFDRGYISLDFMQMLNILGIGYIFRARNERYKNEISKMKTSDEIIDIEVTRNRTRELKTQEYLKGVKEITARVVKYKLETNEEEVLITNLRGEEFNTEEMGELYFKRWGIETGYNIAKNKLNIENISGQSKTIVEQEFYATVLMQNIAEDMKREANSKVEAKKVNGYKYDYKVNINILIGKLRKYFIEIMLDVSEEADKKYEKIIEEMRQELIPIRPNRKNPRRKLSYRAKYRQNVKRNI